MIDELANKLKKGRIAKEKHSSYNQLANTAMSLLMILINSAKSAASSIARQNDQAQAVYFDCKEHQHSLLLAADTPTAVIYRSRVLTYFASR